MDNFIWTNHVKERSYQRGIHENEVWSTLRNPQNSERRSDGSYRFYKNFSGRLVCIVASPQGNKWVIITTFVKDSHSGSYKKYGHKTTSNGPLLQRLVFKLIVSLGNSIAKLFSRR